MQVNKEAGQKTRPPLKKEPSWGSAFPGGAENPPSVGKKAELELSVPRRGGKPALR